MTREDTMSTQKKRSPSFDSMIKFFLKQYNFATKQDINRVVQKIENLEKIVAGGPTLSAKSIRPQVRSARSRSASDMVIDVISEFATGANFTDIQSKTQFEDKKLRNIIYRLTKQGKIRRKKRGVYLTV